MAAAPASSELAHRDKKHDMDKHDDGHGKHGWCIAERESVVGPVCIDVHDVDVLSDILNT